MLLTAALAPAAGAFAADASEGKTVQTYNLSSGHSTVRMSGSYATVPLKDLAVSLGWNISYASSGIYELRKDGAVLTVQVNSAWITHGTGRTSLPVPVRIINQKLYAPVRAVTSLLGGDTVWDPSSRTITIMQDSSTPADILLRYTFAKDAEGWIAGSADLPVDHAGADYQLRSGQALIPLAGKPKTSGFMLSGMNRSDDLFMFLTRKLGSAEGIKPDTEYRIHLSFDLATSEGSSGMGIGGSPAQSVYVKAGIVNKAPAVIEDNSNGTPYYRLNLDKGNQSTDGKDMALLGNIEKPGEGNEGYALKHFDQEFTVKSNTSGELYLIIGTDSGYEGLTSIYYTNIGAEITEVK